MLHHVAAAVVAVAADAGVAVVVVVGADAGVAAVVVVVGAAIVSRLRQAGLLTLEDLTQNFCKEARLGR